MTVTGREGTVYLIDAYALIFQVFYAVGNMSSPTGLPTNALFGFTRDLLFLHGEKKPDYLIVVFDEGDPQFRIDLFADYKANRSAMPEDLQVQLEPMQQMLSGMNVASVSKAGYEADDVIATIAAAGEAKGLDVYICSSDKDCRQLITDRVKIYNLRKNQLLGREELAKDWGVTPEQAIDFQALTGDSVDNIAGVPGIGNKTAAKLLQEFGNVANLFANIDKVSGKKRQENLKDSVDIVKRNQQLVRLLPDVPMELHWDDWRRREMDVPRLLDLFREWSFHRFANQIAKDDGASEPRRPRKSAQKADEPGGLFDELEDAGTKQPAKLAWDADYQLVDDEAKLTAVLKKLAKQKRIAIDLETTDLQPWRADIVGYAISCQAGQAWYIAVRGPRDCATLDPEATLERLRPILQEERIAKVNQNIKYDALVLRQQKVELRGLAGDSMIADYLLNAGEKNRGMQYLARTYLQHEVIPITDLIGKNGPKQLRMDQVNPKDVAVYAGEDADVAWRLCELLATQLEQENLKGLYDDLEIPLIEVLVELEHNGIRLDVDRLKKMSLELAENLADIEQSIYDIAEEEFNIASLKQLRRVMFDKLKLPVKRKTGITGEPSTDQETLEWLAGQGHELPKHLLKHRKVSKLKGTYVDALPKLVNPKNGRVHTSFQQTVAATGRLSSSDPNLQNIPIRTEMGGQIRQAFLPEEGWMLLAADYSQIELRLLAHFSEDAELLQAFHDDRDIHTLVAAQIYGVEDNVVSSEMRRMAKTVNFGVIYGMSAFGLAQRLEIDRKAAETFIESYFARYPKVLEYQQQLLARCRKDGYVSTILGRRRAFQPEVIREDSTYRQRNQAEREAINMEIQGSAADLIKIAMLKVYHRLRGEKRQTRMLLQIHDELVFEVPPVELNDSARLIHDEMLGALADRLRVPLKVDIGVGPNWLDVEEYSEVQ